MQNCSDLGETLAKNVWPPQSPDLNIIENLWSYLAAEVEKHRPTTEKGLIRAIKKEFKRVPAELCKRLVKSLPGRLKDVADCEGNPLDK